MGDILYPQPGPIMEYPNQFEISRAALSAAATIPAASVEELLLNASVIMQWLSPQHVMVKRNTGGTPQGARGGPQEALTPTDGQPEPDRL